MFHLSRSWSLFLSFRLWIRAQVRKRFINILYFSTGIVGKLALRDGWWIIEDVPRNPHLQMEWNPAWSNNILAAILQHKEKKIRGHNSTRKIEWSPFNCNYQLYHGFWKIQRLKNAIVKMHNSILTTTRL